MLVMLLRYNRCAGPPYTMEDLCTVGVWRALQTHICIQPPCSEGDEAHLQVINPPPGVPIKLCRCCNHHKPLTDFYRSKTNADGYVGRCKACHRVQLAESRRKKPRVEVSQVCKIANEPSYGIGHLAKTQSCYV